MLQVWGWQVAPRTAPNLVKITKTSALPPNTEQNPNIHTTFSTNGHVPLDMWQNINKQFTFLKLNN